MPRQQAKRSSREPLTLFPDTPRWCPGCQQHLPRSAFNKDQKNRDGLNSHCRECRATKKKIVYPSEAKRFAINHVRRAYGIEPEEFAQMVAAQGNACTICGDDMGQGKGRHVDHCHDTGRIRSLLCHHCNVAIGHARDDPQLLRTMADYIERHRRLNDDAT